MANIKSAKKRIRQSEKRRLHNRTYSSASRTYVRTARALIEAGNIEEAEKAVSQACSALDKAGRKNVIHPRNAARRKGRLMAALAKAKASA